MVKHEIRKLIKMAVENLGAKLPDFSVEKPIIEEHGDYSTNVAFEGAKFLKKSPMEVAKMIELRIKNYESRIFEKIEVVKPGFINFFLSKEYLQKKGTEFLFKELGSFFPKISKGQKVNVEFISANPTGPLTLGNGRGGFCGDVLANVLEKAGYKVCREYYINDRGKQIEDLKKGLYKGEKRTAVQIQKENQRVITKKLKINFDVWFSEKSLYKSKEVDKILDYFKKKELSYKKEGALWFKSTNFGDDKDRVLVKKDGEKTYLASDSAYLKNKFDRGFDKLIFLWGADHAGYIKRIKAAVRALGHTEEQVDFIIMQLVQLFKGAKLLRMSKRAGRFITLEELVDEVGLDVTRFFFLQRSADSHLNFNMDLAKERSEKNPVYYIQYAYARICSILRKLKTQNSKLKTTTKNLKLLNHQSELVLIKQLIRFPEIVEDTANDYQVQRLPNYALELVAAFHKFYEECRVISKNEELSSSRLGLTMITKKILKEILDLMGITAPEKM